MVSFPSVVFSVVIDRFNDERLQCKEQAPCAAYLSLKNRELQQLLYTRRQILIFNNKCGLNLVD
jgi:hypothetical protein